MKKQHGYLLLMVLVIFSIMLMLSLTAIKYLIYFTKINHERIISLQLQQDSTLAFKKIVGNLKISARFCKIPLSNSNTLARKTTAWWLNHGCLLHFKDARYYFVLEDLTIDPCAFIKGKVAHYYRFTLIHLTTNVFNPIQQIYWVKAVSSEVSCEKVPRLIHPGIQTWR